MVNVRNIARPKLLKTSEEYCCCRTEIFLVYRCGLPNHVVWSCFIIVLLWQIVSIHVRIYFVCRYLCLMCCMLCVHIKSEYCSKFHSICHICYMSCTLYISAMLLDCALKFWIPFHLHGNRSVHYQLLTKPNECSVCACYFSIYWCQVREKSVCICLRACFIIIYRHNNVQ